MLFSDLTKSKAQELNPEFEKLFNLAIVNQNHPGDIILLHQNGTYDPSVTRFEGVTLNPHVIGPGRIGWSYYTHYQFINQYRQTQTAKVTHVEWTAKIQELIEAQNWNERDKHVDFEASTIHIETLVYLKIWESDYFIKTLYEFARMLEGKPYDWNFRIYESARDSGATGVRHDIIRKYIRDKIKKFSPKIYDALKLSYFTQLRNSIAHSNFIFQGDYMQLGNYIEDDPHSQVRAISFQEWTEKFHTTMIIYDNFIGILNRAREYSKALMDKSKNVHDVLVTDKRDKGNDKTYLLPVVYDPEFERYSYKQN
ncbi:hypothetical protein [Hymenobacter chitinivorans]|uniref:Uncharacterized protein n=1 Tax=Hymenobacter chitinivorans DSM 11115 TaxID=1121954 RepID=A0A2M9BSU5_9BACT|nr:hypothetical protein [Hymenobacter chitinivorans]PJJ61003.1 hypothetical protein CLV45_2440 [Hymenobacter chitinivorans DSM 11115]